MVKVFSSIENNYCLELFLHPVPYQRMLQGDRSNLWHFAKYRDIKSHLLFLSARGVENAHKLLRVAMFAEALQKDYYGDWITIVEKEDGLRFESKFWEKAVEELDIRHDEKD